MHKSDSELDFYLRRNKLSKDDKDILNSLIPVVDAIANVFGKSCEVVLHSLEDPAHSVKKISNPYITHRKEGSPLTDLAIKALIESSENNGDVIGSYYTRTKDNKLLKSITAIIKNASGTPIGMLCINIDVSTGFSDFVQSFIPDLKQEENGKDVENFVTDIRELIDVTLQEAMTEINMQRGLSGREKNLNIIKILYDKKIFNIKGAVETVADALGISKFTLYSYLRELRERS